MVMKNKIIAVAAATLVSTLILMLIKLTIDAGISWIWVFAPMYLPFLILVVPWLVTVGLLGFHQMFGDK